MTLLRDLVRDFLHRADLVLLGLCILANSFGIVLIYSATRYSQKLANYPMKQLFAMCLGIVCYIVFTYVDLDVLIQKWKWLFAFSILFILALRTPLGIAGDTGNLSWLDIPGLPFNVQPAEIVKLIFTMILAYQLCWLQESRKGVSSVLSIAQLAGHLAFMCGLIFAVSGDAGSMLIYCFIFAVMLWAAGVSKRWFLIGGGLAAGLCALAWNLVDKGSHYYYMKLRFLVLLDHDLDPLGKGYHQLRSLLAIGSGRLTGMGLLHGTQTQSVSSSALPERHTDFIFSVCGEELGMLGCVAVMLLLAAIILRCFYIGLKAPSSFSALVCFGYSGMLLAQSALNIGMCLYVAPVIGITLPFFSYGGSSIITMYAAMGIVSGVKAKMLPSWLKDRTG